MINITIHGRSVPQIRGAQPGVAQLWRDYVSEHIGDALGVEVHTVDLSAHSTGDPRIDGGDEDTRGEIAEWLAGAGWAAFVEAIDPRLGGRDAGANT